MSYSAILLSISDTLFALRTNWCQLRLEMTPRARTEGANNVTDALKRSFASFPTGVAAICARIDGQDTGFVVSSFSVGVSLDPALVSFAVKRESATWPKLRIAAQLGVSILAEGQDDICRKLAGPESHRFLDVDIVTSSVGSLFISGAASWFECVVHREIPAGDHQLVLLEVQSVHGVGDNAPLVYHESTFKRLSAAEA